MVPIRFRSALQCGPFRIRNSENSEILDVDLVSPYLEIGYLKSF